MVGAQQEVGVEAGELAMQRVVVATRRRGRLGRMQPRKLWRRSKRKNTSSERQRFHWSRQRRAASRPKTRQRAQPAQPRPHGLLLRQQARLLLKLPNELEEDVPSFVGEASGEG